MLILLVPVTKGEVFVMSFRTLHRPFRIELTFVRRHLIVNMYNKPYKANLITSLFRLRLQRL